MGETRKIIYGGLTQNKEQKGETKLGGKRIQLKVLSKLFFPWNSRFSLMLRRIFLENDEVNKVSTFSFLPSSAKPQVPHFLEHFQFMPSPRHEP